MTFNIFFDLTREEISTKSTSTAVFSFNMAGSISMNSFTYVRGCQAKICTEKDKHSYKGNFLLSVESILGLLKNCNGSSSLGFVIGPETSCQNVNQSQLFSNV